MVASAVSLFPLFLALAFPVAVYCLLLALLNRGRPVLVPGVWDLLGLLFAVSGFLLFAGPAVLTNLYERQQLALILEHRRPRDVDNPEWRRDVGDLTVELDLREPPHSAERVRFTWTVAWFLYYLAILLGVGILWYRRRRLTEVYNVELPVFERTLTRVLNRLDVDGSWEGNRLQLAAKSGDEAQPAPGQVTLNLVPSYRHVTLAWGEARHALRGRVEAELDRDFRQMRAAENVLGTAFLMASVVLFFATLLLAGVVTLALVARYLRG